MEKILIIGLLTIAGVITALILFMGSQSSIQEASDQNREKQSQAGLKAQTIIEILNVRTGDNGSALDVWVKNRGVAGISTQDIENLEVFLITRAMPLSTTECRDGFKMKTPALSRI